MKSIVSLLLIVLLAEQSFVTSFGVTKEEYGKHVPGEKLLREEIVKVLPNPKSKAPTEAVIEVVLPNEGSISFLELFHSNDPQYEGTEYDLSMIMSEIEEIYWITLQNSAGSGIDTKVLVYGTLPEEEEATKVEYGEHVPGEKLIREEIVKVLPNPESRTPTEAVIKIVLPDGGFLSFLELFNSNDRDYIGTQYDVSQTMSEIEQIYWLKLRNSPGRGIDTKVLIYGTLPEEQEE